jgi:hypothetical protein
MNEPKPHPNPSIFIHIFTMGIWLREVLRQPADRFFGLETHPLPLSSTEKRGDLLPQNQSIMRR